MDIRNRRRNILRLRGTLVIAVGGLLIDSGATTDSFWPLFVVVAFALSELLLIRLPLRLFESRSFKATMGGVDTALLLVAINLAGMLPVSAQLAPLDEPFLDPVRYRLENGLAWLAAGDLNGDRAADLAAVSRVRGTVSTLIGDGSGGFSGGSTHAVGRRPAFVAMPDLNRDGLADLATISADDQSVSVLLNDGAGALGSPVTYPLGGTPTWLAAGDLDGDRVADIVVASTSAVLVLPGLGAGAFGPAVVWPVTGANLSQGTLADLDGDGRLDVAVSDAAAGGVAVLLNDGQGGLAAPVPYPSGADPWSVLATDVDVDGTLDLVTANRMDDQVAVLRGLGAGTFGAPSPYAAAKESAYLAQGDFNGDCIMDLAVANGSSGGVVSVLPGNGAGSYLTAESFISGTSPAGIVAEDFNGDLKPDLAYVNTSGVQVLMNNGTEPCDRFYLRRSTDAATVRSSPRLTTTWRSPFDDEPGILGDGMTYFYVVEHAAGLPARISATANAPLNTVRLGFDDGAPDSAAVDVVVSSVSAKPAVILADGDATARVIVIPRDRDGVLLGAGLDLAVDPDALAPGVLAGPVEDRGNGLYWLMVASTRPGTGTVLITVEGLFLNESASITFQAP